MEAEMKVGVIGCGYWGKNLVRNFYELGALGLVCESLPSNQEVTRRVAPGVPITESLHELLSSDVDGVVIATPAATHYELGSKALAAGKDVFVEKPLALTLAEGRDLAEQAQDGQILMVGHILEYHPACVGLVELVRAGELGDVCYIYSNRLSLGKVRREENILWSFAPHDVAMMNRIVGSLPDSVSAFGGAYVQEHNADVTVTNLRYPGGIRGHIHVSWLHPFKEQRLVVIGAQKMATFDGVAGTVTLYDQRVEWQRGEPVPIKADGELIATTNEEPLRRECRAFLEAMRTRTQPLTDAVNGLEVLSVLESAQKSLESDGKAIRVQPITSTLV